MERLNLKKLLKGTEFEDKAERLQRRFDAVGVTLENIDNLPQMGHPLGCDVYLLKKIIVERHEEQQNPPEKPPAKPTNSRQKKTAEVEDNG